MRFKQLIFLSVFLGMSFSLFGTHIVGGEMNYTCLGDNQYEITLTIFRDCFNGNPQAWFDDPASIGVFDANNVLLQQILVPLMNNDTLNPVLTDECLVVPPNVCVHTTTYRTTVELPPIIGGYQLAYQRCCRNQTIVNIIDPLDSGATYGVTISEKALLECNSNPKFKEWPPIYICVNEPIVFDQSAVDMDGDSIVYRLCTPLLGATPDIPMPQPPNNPPYDPINWIDPPYNVNNMLNGRPGDPPLRINPQTGLLTGLPNTIGQFVVGICVEEYRDGILISTTRRDFQYNVGVCGQAVSSFFAPEVLCDSFTLNLQNESLGANHYLWKIDDPLNPGFESTDANLTYTFPDTGLYTITLIAEPSSVCADTFSRQVSVQYPSLFADFDFEFIECTDSLTIEVRDLSVDSISTPVSWSWELFPLGITSEERNPVFNVSTSQEVVLTLTVTAANGCARSTQRRFFADLIGEEIEMDSLILCLGDSVMLNPDFDDNYSYSWSNASTLSQANIPNPIAQPEQTTVYSVTITDAVNFCQIQRSVTVLVPEEIMVELPSDTTTCEPEIVLIANSALANQYFWSTSSDFSDVFSNSDTAKVVPLGETSYYLEVRDTFGCIARDSIKLTGIGVNIEPLAPPLRCLGDLLAIAVLNLDEQDTLSYKWTPEELIFNFGDTQTPIIFPKDAGETTFYVEATNQFGCSWMDSIVVTTIDTTNILDAIETTQCSGYSVQFSSSSVNAPFYIWNFGDPSNPGAEAFGEAVRYTYPGPGVYELMVTLDSRIPCSDTLIKNITVGEPNLALDLSWDFESCADTALIRFNNESTNDQSTFSDVSWVFSNGDSSRLDNPLVFLEGDDTLGVQLILQSEDGCLDTLSRELEIDLIDLDLTDTIVLCPEGQVELNPNPNTEYQYFWTPVEGLNDPLAPNPIAQPESTTTYSVRVTDVETICEIERSVTVFVAPQFSVELPRDTNICNLDFTLWANSERGAQFEWSEDSDFSTVFSEEPEVTVQPGQPSLYYLRILDDFGCAFLDSIEVGSYPIDVFVRERVASCVGDTITIEALNLGIDQPLFFDWSPAEAILSGANSGTINIIPSQPIQLQLNVTNDTGCSYQTFVQVDTFPNLIDLQLEADPDTLFQPGTSQLLATESTTYIYRWFQGDLLSAPDIFNPLATVSETTTFSLQVEDLNGCTKVASITVVVIDESCVDPFIFIPNGFTPNGDGKNDILFVRGTNIDELYLVIFDRWGEKVFETRQADEGWDGTFEGESLSPDVYGYYLEVRCFNGDEYTKKGNVTLIR